MATWTPIDNTQSASWNSVTTLEGLASNWTTTVASPTVALIFWGGTGGIAMPPSYYVRKEKGTWTLQTFPADALGLVNTTYVNGQFFLFGGVSPYRILGKIYSSYDGITWTSIAAPSPTGLVTDVYGNGTQLGITQSNTSYTSTDNGATWVTGGAKSSAAIQSRTLWDGAKYVSASNGGIYTSTNGATWTNRVSYSLTLMVANIMKNGAWYIAHFCSGTTQQRIYRSTDGISWTQTTGLPFTQQARVVFPFGDVFAVVTSAGAVYRYNPSPQEFTYLGNVTNYVYSGTFSCYIVSKLADEYIFPGVGTTATQGLIQTSTDLTTYKGQVYNTVSLIANTQAAGWTPIAT